MLIVTTSTTYYSLTYLHTHLLTYILTYLLYPQPHSRQDDEHSHREFNPSRPAGGQRGLLLQSQVQLGSQEKRLDEEVSE